MDIEVEYVIKLYLDCELPKDGVYEDYYRYWNDGLRSMFIGRLRGIMRRGSYRNEPLDDVSYGRMIQCIDYLKERAEKEVKL